MFTGIIEDLGKVTDLKKDLSNLHITIHSVLSAELKIDQSVSHNGVCLTVVNKNEKKYTVTAINETLNKTNLRNLKINDVVNLERGMKLGDRLDGHIVQGHVDQVAAVVDIQDKGGSWEFEFAYQDEGQASLLVEKGSITVDGVSLTCFDVKRGGFYVAIIPYTYSHTSFENLKLGSKVNLEFDVIGKYVAKMLDNGE